MQELVYVTEEYVDQLVFMPQNRKDWADRGRQEV